MSKYCLIAKAYTNCTDNCNACMEEEKTEKLVEKVREEQDEWLKTDINVSQMLQEVVSDFVYDESNK